LQALVHLLQHVLRLALDVGVAALGHHAREIDHAVEHGCLAVACRDANTGNVCVVHFFFFAPSLLSLPAIKRLMFSEWRHTSSKAITASASTITPGAFQATR